MMQLSPQIFFNRSIFRDCHILGQDCRRTFRQTLMTAGAEIFTDYFAELYFSSPMLAVIIEGCPG